MVPPIRKIVKYNIAFYLAFFSNQFLAVLTYIVAHPISYISTASHCFKKCIIEAMNRWIKNWLLKLDGKAILLFS